MGTALSSLSDSGRQLYNRLASLFGAENITVTSAGRPGDPRQHGSGDAIDFKVKGYTNAQAQAIIAHSDISYNQLINEISGPASSGPHLHIGAGTGNENLVYQGGKYRPITSGALANQLPDFNISDALKGNILTAPFGIGADIGAAIADGSIADMDPTGIVGGIQDLLNGKTAARFAAGIIGIILITVALVAFIMTTDTGKEAAKAIVTKGA